MPEPIEQQPIHKWTPVDIAAWLAKHEKPTARKEVVAQGFGDGRFTLYLPSPLPGSRIVFKDGKPHREVIESCMTDPAIAELRERAIGAFDERGISCDLTFFEYASAIVGLNYTFSDDELTMLLGGSKWHKAMLQHLVGGEDVIDSLAEMAGPIVQ